MADLGGCDRADPVAVDLSPGTDAVGFTRLVFTGPPEWVHRLPALRDTATAPLGLQPQRRVPAAEIAVIRVGPGLKMGPFPACWR